MFKPALFSGFSAQLEHVGWEVHHNLEHVDARTSLEEIDGSSDEKQRQLEAQLRELAAIQPQKALIIKTSHIGGHKFSGNVQVRITPAPLSFD